MEKNFIFLNRSQSLSEINWNGCNTIVSKLWRYNQHYFDYLNEINSSQYLKYHIEILENWHENKDFKE